MKKGTFSSCPVLYKLIPRNKMHVIKQAQVLKQNWISNLRLGLPETDSHASSSRQQRKLEIKEKVLLNEAS